MTDCNNLDFVISLQDSEKIILHDATSMSYLSVKFRYYTLGIARRRLKNRAVERNLYSQDDTFL